MGLYCDSILLTDIYEGVSKFSYVFEKCDAYISSVNACSFAFTDHCNSELNSMKCRLLRNYWGVKRLTKLLLLLVVVLISFFSGISVVCY